MDNSPAAPIPVVLFGKDPKIAKAVSDKLLPDFEVVHACHDLSSALREIPPLFNPATNNLTSHRFDQTFYNLEPPKSHIGKIPQAVFFGGKFSDDEYQAIVNAVTDVVDKVASVAAASAAAPSPPPPYDQSSSSSASASASGSGNAQVAASSASASSAASSASATGVPVQFIKCQKRDVFAAGSFGPNPDVIAKVFRKKMAAAVAAAGLENKDKPPHQQQHQQQQQADPRHDNQRLWTPQPQRPTQPQPRPQQQQHPQQQPQRKPEQRMWAAQPQQQQQRPQQQQQKYQPQHYPTLFDSKFLDN